MGAAMLRRAQDPLPNEGGTGPAPRACVVGRPGGTHCGVDALFAGLGDLAEQVAGRGVAVLETPAPGLQKRPPMNGPVWRVALPASWTQS